MSGRCPRQLEGQSTALAGRLVILDGDMQTGYPLATTVAALVSAKSEFPSRRRSAGASALRAIATDGG